MNHDARAVLPWSDVAEFYAQAFNYKPTRAEIAKALRL